MIFILILCVYNFPTCKVIVLRRDKKKKKKKVTVASHSPIPFMAFRNFSTSSAALKFEEGLMVPLVPICNSDIYLSTFSVEQCMKIIINIKQVFGTKW